MPYCPISNAITSATAPSIFSGGGKCQSRHLTVPEIREVFDTSPLEAKAENLRKALDGINEKVQNEIRSNACITQNQDEYEKRYNALCNDYETTREKLDAVLSAISNLQSERFFKEVKEIKSIVSEFDEKAFERLVERMVIRDDGIEVVWDDGI